jgi:hypothetical protein
MTLTPGETYEIVYVAHGEERSAHAHYRGQGSADTIARGEESVTPHSEEDQPHWFRVDGEAGYLVVEPDDLISFELVARH